MSSSTNEKEHVLPTFYIDSFLKHPERGVFRVIGFSRNGATDDHELWVIVKLLAGDYGQLVPFEGLLAEFTVELPSKVKIYVPENFSYTFHARNPALIGIHKGVICKHFKGGEYLVLGFLPRCLKTSDGTLEDVVFYCQPGTKDPISLRHRTVSDFVAPMDRVLEDGTRYVGPRFFPVET